MIALLWMLLGLGLIALGLEIRARGRKNERTHSRFPAHFWEGLKQG